MAIYKYSDFEKQLQASGLAGQFSTADMALAQQNPDAGMAILSAKKNYAAATNPTARALANAEADKVRKSYGGYTGGADGGSFNLEPLSPNSYRAPDAPVYDNAYKDRINTALSKVENGLEFSYDAASDPVYQAYDKKYTREGQLATEDVLGRASMMTGGAPSTAAITAAGQTANQYAAAKADIIPTLYQQAFDRAMAEFNADRAVLGDLLAVDSQEFGKYQTELGQHNTENAFKYGQLLDEIGAQADVRDEEFKKQQYADSLKQLEILNQRYDTEYEDKQKQQNYQNWLQSEALKMEKDETERNNRLEDEAIGREVDQQQKDNERADRELALKESSAYLDNQLTQAEIDSMKNGKTDTGIDSDTYKQLKATYDAVYDASVRELTSKLQSMIEDETTTLSKPEALTNEIVPFETWYRLRQIGYSGYDAYDSYDAYIEDVTKELLEEAKRMKE